MNWKRGLLRTWLVASALWVALTFWWREICLIPSLLGGGVWWCADELVDPVGENLKSVLFLLGYAPLWAGRGIRSKP
jgi:hypothetical protein